MLLTLEAVVVTVSVVGSREQVVTTLLLTTLLPHSIVHLLPLSAARCSLICSNIRNSLVFKIQVLSSNVKRNNITNTTQLTQQRQRHNQTIFYLQLS